MSSSVLIPAFNEQRSIRKIVVSAKKYVDEVVVVNDHSTDSTEREARDAGARVIANALERGRQFALLNGVKSIENEIVVTLDGDGQHPPSMIPQLLEPIMMDQADFVIGLRSRLPPSEKPLRKFASLKLGWKGEDPDVGSGFVAFKRKFLAEMQPEDLGFCSCGSFVLFAASRSARITEVKFQVHPRLAGKSKFSHVRKSALHEKQLRFLRERYIPRI